MVVGRLPERETGELIRQAGRTIEDAAAIVTQAAEGSAVAQGGETIRALTPTVKVVDSCGAGATYSAGFIYGCLRGWSLEETIRFVTVAAAIRCTLVGMQVSPVADVLKTAAEQV